MRVFSRRIVNDTAPPDARRRQYYMITDDGRAALADHQRQWVAVTRALNDVWPGSKGPLAAVGEV